MEKLKLVAYINLVSSNRTTLLANMLDELGVRTFPSLFNNVQVSITFCFGVVGRGFVNYQSGISSAGVKNLKGLFV